MSFPIAAAGVAALLLIASTVPAAVSADAEGTVTELALSDGGMERVLFASPANPTATLIMLPGGNGMVDFARDGTVRQMANSFLLRTLPLWQEQGFAAAVLSPPNGMSLLGYRHTPASAVTVGQAVDFVRSRANVPVWLIGTSQGTTAAVGAAARLGDKVAGIVLMSPVTGRSSAGETLFDSEPERVAVPVLIVTNSADTCPASPPSAAARIGDALTHAPRIHVLSLESAPTQEHPCDAQSPHAYFGIEQTAVAAVAQWIASAGDHGGR